MQRTCTFAGSVGMMLLIGLLGVLPLAGCSDEAAAGGEGDELSQTYRDRAAEVLSQAKAERETAGRVSDNTIYDAYILMQTPWGLPEPTRRLLIGVMESRPDNLTISEKLPQIKREETERLKQEADRSPDG